MAEKLREQFNSALVNAGNGARGYYRTSSSYTTGNLGNGVGCTTECRLLPGFTGKSQQELDVIARDMTNQIVTDLRSGKLHRSQVNQPDWFEHRVADKLSDLQQQHQLEFDRNLQSAASRFHQRQSTNQWNDLQQHQQPIFTQSQQQQQQGNFYQQQSQSQHQNYGYVQPVISGNTYQKVSEAHHNSHSQSVYPTPVTVLQGTTVLQEENCTTDQNQGAVYPLFNVQNQFNQHRTENNRQTTGGTTYIRPAVSGGTTYHVTTTVERNENRTPQRPIIIPTQNTYTREYEEEQREIRRQQTQPQIYGINQQNRTEHVENRNIDVYTPVPLPLPVTNHRHNIYHHEHESEVVPNYRPRVVIDKDTKFHELEVQNHHREYQPVPVPIPTGSTTTHVTEEERIDRHYQPRPAPIPTGSSTTTHVKEEEQIDRRYQPRPVYRPQVTTTTVTKEEEQVNRETNQRPIVQYPQQNTVTQDVSEEIHSTQHTAQRPQYPVFSHHTETQTFNETNNQNTQTIQTRPAAGGQTTTTIKETHYVQILPQPADQYTIHYTKEEYLERLNRIRQELSRLGYGTLTEDEYNATISSGGFIHNGYKYLYNADRGRYEKTNRVEITEEEYHTQLRRLQDQLHQNGLNQMTEQEYNQTIDNGYFDRSGNRYIYDSETGTYHKEQINEEQYVVLRQRIQDELTRLGWGGISDLEFNQTIATGQIIINGNRYIVNKRTGQLEQGGRVEISEQEYRTILRRLQDQLRHLGFDQMTEREYNQTITSGYFVRGGNKYRYNAEIGRYEKVELTEDEYNVILSRLQETLKRLNYRQMSDRESNETIATGTFIRGGYQWTYDTETGGANAVRIAGPFEEITEAEYRAIYKQLQKTLSRLGYPHMTESECNKTIASGSFVRGGNQWVYQPESAEFQRTELSETEYNFRVERLVEALARLGIQKNANEYREIINRGNFYHGGQRYEYDVTSQQFVRIELTEAEYRERVRKLLEQLRRIGYGTMNESECRATINSGVFYYGGHEWVYNNESGQYEMGQLSDKENGIIDDNYFNTIGLDSTNYGSSNTDNGKDREGHFDIDKDDDKNGRKKEIISKNRGDQPPQTFEEDYEESEELEKEPGIGYYPRPREPITQRPLPVAVTKPAPRQPEPQPVPVYEVPLAPYQTETDQKRFEGQRTETVFAVPPPTEETEYERRYHRKQTTYTQTSGVVSLFFSLNFNAITLHLFCNILFQLSLHKRFQLKFVVGLENLDQPELMLKYQILDKQLYLLHMIMSMINCNKVKVFSQLNR